MDSVDRLLLAREAALGLDLRLLGEGVTEVSKTVYVSMGIFTVKRDSLLTGERSLEGKVWSSGKERP